jgi:HIRAN domain
MANYLLAGDGQFGFQAVGESHYQSELAKIAGGITDEGVHHACAAVLRLEPTNKYDPHAVEVLIAGMRVGYIPAVQAPEMCALFDSVGITPGAKRSFRADGTGVEAIWEPSASG